MWGLEGEVPGGRQTLLISVPNFKCLIVVAVTLRKQHQWDMFGPEGCCVAGIQAGMRLE